MNGFLNSVLKGIYVSVAENAEEKISIQLLNNKQFYGTFNSNFSLQNKQLRQMEQNGKKWKKMEKKSKMSKFLKIKRKKVSLQYNFNGNFYTNISLKFQQQKNTKCFLLEQNGTTLEQNGTTLKKFLEFFLQIN